MSRYVLESLAEEVAISGLTVKGAMVGKKMIEKKFIVLCVCISVANAETSGLSDTAELSSTESRDGENKEVLQAMMSSDSQHPGQIKPQTKSRKWLETSRAWPQNQDTELIRHQDNIYDYVNYHLSRIQQVKKTELDVLHGLKKKYEENTKKAEEELDDYYRVFCRVKQVLIKGKLNSQIANETWVQEFLRQYQEFLKQYRASMEQLSLKQVLERDPWEMLEKVLHNFCNPTVHPQFKDVSAEQLFAAIKQQAKAIELQNEDKKIANERIFHQVQTTLYKVLQDHLEEHEDWQVKVLDALVEKWGLIKPQIDEKKIGYDYSNQRADYTEYKEEYLKSIDSQLKLSYYGYIVGSLPLDDIKKVFDDKEKSKWEKKDEVKAKLEGLNMLPGVGYRDTAKLVTTINDNTTYEQFLQTLLNLQNTKILPAIEQIFQAHSAKTSDLKRQLKNIVLGHYKPYSVSQEDRNKVIEKISKCSTYEQFKQYMAGSRGTEIRPAFEMLLKEEEEQKQEFEEEKQRQLAEILDEWQKRLIQSSSPAEYAQTIEANPLSDTKNKAAQIFDEKAAKEQELYHKRYKIVEKYYKPYGVLPENRQKVIKTISKSETVDQFMQYMDGIFTKGQAGNFLVGRSVEAQFLTSEDDALSTLSDLLLQTYEEKMDKLSADEDPDAWKVLEQILAETIDPLTAEKFENTALSKIVNNVRQQYKQVELQEEQEYITSKLNYAANKFIPSDEQEEFKYSGYWILQDHEYHYENAKNTGEGLNPDESRRAIAAICEALLTRTIKLPGAEVKDESQQRGMALILYLLEKYCDTPIQDTLVSSYKNYVLDRLQTPSSKRNTKYKAVYENLNKLINAPDDESEADRKMRYKYRIALQMIDWGKLTWTKTASIDLLVEALNKVDIDAVMSDLDIYVKQFDVDAIFKKAQQIIDERRFDAFKIQDWQKETDETASKGRGSLVQSSEADKKFAEEIGAALKLDDADDMDLDFDAEKDLGGSLPDFFSDDVKFESGMKDDETQYHEELTKELDDLDFEAYEQETAKMESTAAEENKTDLFAVSGGSPTFEAYLASITAQDLKDRFEILYRSILSSELFRHPELLLGFDKRNIAIDEIIPEYGRIYYEHEGFKEDRVAYPYIINPTKLLTGQTAEDIRNKYKNNTPERIIDEDYEVSDPKQLQATEKAEIKKLLEAAYPKGISREDIQKLIADYSTNGTGNNIPKEMQELKKKYPVDANGEHEVFYFNTILNTPELKIEDGEQLKHLDIPRKVLDYKVLLDLLVSWHRAETMRSIQYRLKFLQEKWYGNSQASNQWMTIQKAALEQSIRVFEQIKQKISAGQQESPNSDQNQNITERMVLAINNWVTNSANEKSELKKSQGIPPEDLKTTSHDAAEALIKEGLERAADKRVKEAFSDAARSQRREEEKGYAGVWPSPFTSLVGDKFGSDYAKKMRWQNISDNYIDYENVYKTVEDWLDPNVLSKRMDRLYYGTQFDSDVAKDETFFKAAQYPKIMIKSMPYLMKKGGEWEQLEKELKGDQQYIATVTPTGKVVVYALVGYLKETGKAWLVNYTDFLGREQKGIDDKYSEGDMFSYSDLPLSGQLELVYRDSPMDLQWKSVKKDQNVEKPMSVGHSGGKIKAEQTREEYMRCKYAVWVQVQDWLLKDAVSREGQ